MKDHSTALRLAATALLLGLLIHLVGWRDLAQGLLSARGSWLAAMYAVVLCNFGLMAVCLWFVLTRSGVDVSIRRVLFANALANLYALVLPGDLLAGASKWVLISTATGRRALVFSAIVLNKVALGLAPLLFGTLALAVDAPFPGWRVGEFALGAGCAIAAGLVLLLHPRAAGFVERWIRTAAAPFPAAVRSGVEKLLDALRAFRGFGFRDYATVLGLSLAIFWLGIGSFACATRALGLEVPVPTLVWITLALFASRLLPITFNNLGVRESLLVLALGTQSVDPAQAVGVGLVMFSNTIFTGLIGAVCQGALALGWANLSGAPARADAE